MPFCSDFKLFRTHAAAVVVAPNASTSTGSSRCCTRSVIEAWRIEYNTERTHSSLDDLTPKEFAVKLLKQDQPSVHLPADSNPCRTKTGIRSRVPSRTRYPSGHDTCEDEPLHRRLAGTSASIN